MKKTVKIKLDIMEAAELVRILDNYLENKTVVTDNLIDEIDYLETLICFLNEGSKDYQDFYEEIMFKRHDLENLYRDNDIVENFLEKIR